MSMKFIDIESLRVCGIFPVGKEPSIRTLRSWTKWGILPHYKIGHFVYYDEKEVTDHFGMKFKVPIVDIHKLRARAELARAELATEREKVTMLLSDAYALTKNWHDRAERAEADAERYRLVTLRQDAELATERGKLDWVFQNCKVEANDYTTGNLDVYYVHDREDLGVAMKDGAN